MGFLLFVTLDAPVSANKHGERVSRRRGLWVIKTLYKPRVSIRPCRTMRGSTSAWDSSIPPWDVEAMYATRAPLVRANCLIPLTLLWESVPRTYELSSTKGKASPTNLMAPVAFEVKITVYSVAGASKNARTQARASSAHMADFWELCDSNQYSFSCITELLVPTWC
jgi:hypothetical protein